ncbi:hypothetical protein DZC75_14480 [Pseudomonas parafulva]|uniref:Aminotransferase n=1 Tax=Pseudomonas parafulva TaxID=157782 RepID=A0AAI8KCP2_9PSED|nr:hypothetical protein [Pseudomonas parafulva]AIZ33483.1 hypothetical protein NJ69_11035 [Pseudomonas parafulva]AXO89151.1 hypothetical protein DZC75_14480 [Pseudomonas parafulva]
MLEAIGGYFELELRTGLTPYPDAVGFNCARSALTALLEASAAPCLYLPYYICQAVVEAAQVAGSRPKPYAIDMDFELLQLPALKADERLLYVNYFGLKDTYVREVLAPRYGDRLIVDNSQALFSTPLPGISTLYSPRKFVGVADGGWLANPPERLKELPQSQSRDRFGALLGRLESAPEEHYLAFTEAEKALAQAPVSAMSQSTRRLLDSLDYAIIADRRRDNFIHLCEAFDRDNLFKPGVTAPQVAALSYPLLLGSPAQAQYVRQALREERIFIPCYWPEVVNAAQSPNVERLLAGCVLPLPVDQRYHQEHMQRLIDRVHWHMATC